MPKTIEQRWKAVGVEREEVARLASRTSKYHWHKVDDWNLSLYRTSADALLPLIEKAVGEARKDGHRDACPDCSIKQDGKYTIQTDCPRIAELEARDEAP